MMSKKAILVTIMLAVFLTIKPYEATRVLDEEEKQWLKRGQDLLLPSLQWRPVRPPSPSSCSWVGTPGGAPCTASIGQRNFAGRAVASPPPPPPLASDAYPKQMFEFGMAAGRK
ncbi:hypothetical protein C2S52_022473 [Perilla frutescens var. hirtella]|nr:hypothetical protein C2S52_022473 [Perilla frutescens var. hirtella]KAH6807157.1 hypothetical protein C2S51_028265 [Perilla frutescens var. frutescens]